MRAALVGAAFFVVRGAGAGEQLSTADLVQRSEAVVVIDNTLDRKGTVTSWLKGSAALSSTLAPLAGLCVPDKALLQQWTATHPQHAGRATWQKSVAAGHVEQVVFLAMRAGRLVPTCETEVMLGRSFALHPDYPAFRAELDRLLASAATPASAAEAAASTATSPGPAPSGPVPSGTQAAGAVPPPPSSSGCL
jgi:hypothetical protein